jgi:hypothetical protein
MTGHRKTVAACVISLAIGLGWVATRGESDLSDAQIDQMRADLMSPAMMAYHRRSCAGLIPGQPVEAVLLNCELAGLTHHDKAWMEDMVARLAEKCKNGDCPPLPNDR